MTAEEMEAETLVRQHLGSFAASTAFGKTDLSNEPAACAA